MSSITNLIVSDFLFILIVVGWVVLVIAGIEPDKPLSGGLPGHVDLSQHESQSEGRLGRLGEPLAWALFGVVSLSLPLILWWIFRTQSGA